MNLFGFEIKFNGKNNKNGFVKQDECHRAMDRIEESIERVDKNVGGVHSRIDNIFEILTTKK